MKQKLFNLLSNKDFWILIISIVVFVVSLKYYLPYLVLGALINENSSVVFALFLIGSLISIINSAVRLKNANK
jgi:hypothetical protein